MIKIFLLNYYKTCLLICISCIYLTNLPNCKISVFSFTNHYNTLVILFTYIKLDLGFLKINYLLKIYL